MLCASDFILSNFLPKNCKQLSKIIFLIKKASSPYIAVYYNACYMLSIVD